jgi:hypothetical protein
MNTQQGRALERQGQLNVLRDQARRLSGMSALERDLSAPEIPAGTTMGVVHAARFYRKLAKGLKPRRPSVLERIKACQTGTEVHVLMGETLTYEASADTRRKWAELAEERLASFRVAALSAQTPVSR